jgi:hypothetical protein
MAGPTDLLNEDVKELKGEIRDVRNGLDGLKGEVHRLDVGLARLQTEFGLAKWLLGLLLVATVSGIGTGIWWAATITADVRSLDKRFDKLESAVLKAIEAPRQVAPPAPTPQPVPEPRIEEPRKEEIPK